MLWRLDVSTGRASGLVPIAHEGLPAINNDHVLDPDGHHIYLSANDGHIYRAALEGGPVDKVTSDEGVWHFLHGVSPDGRRLAYVRLADFTDPGGWRSWSRTDRPLWWTPVSDTSTAPSGRPTVTGST